MYNNMLKKGFFENTFKILFKKKNLRSLTLQLQPALNFMYLTIT